MKWDPATFACLAATAYAAPAPAPAPQGVPESIAPAGAPPAGCEPSYPGTFGITVVPVSAPAKRDVQVRTTDQHRRYIS